MPDELAGTWSAVSTRQRQTDRSLIVERAVVTTASREQSSTRNDGDVFATFAKTPLR